MTKQKKISKPKNLCVYEQWEKNIINKRMTKQEKIDKLKDLGVYEQWEKNIINYRGNESVNKYLNYDCGFRDFIGRSFLWVLTPEKYKFWKEISLK